MPSSYDARPAASAITVSELNRQVKQLLEQSLPLTWIAGEISNLTRAASGHWYFSLKDAQAQARCVMFRHRNQALDWTPENGAQVEVRALATLYAPRGEFQLNVEAMRRAGLGALFEAFERLKHLLEKEGLFDAARKLPLPFFPRQIGVITSPAAAALHDVLTTLRRRLPSIPVILYPTPVQGKDAAAQIVQAIHAAAARNECDVLILCRGGGSIEDLWPFNEEAVARAISGCPIPIVCGVGHETDVTIADFTADQRAPTPTAAAEMACPHRADLARRLEIAQVRLTRHMRNLLENRMQQIDYLSRRLLHPGERLKNQAQQLTYIQQRLGTALAHSLHDAEWKTLQWRHRLQHALPDLTRLESQRQEWARRLPAAHARRLHTLEATLAHLQASLTHLNPLGVLKRGYSLVTHEDGRIIQDSASVAVGEKIAVTFSRGGASAQITDKRR
ncbi:MAG TPA: exodeoxyribonuclease VII large subunit [Betaproteobacteria bacterium]|nr:exodeoxyribonuclease VII large subunit [Betaproteobacteria bacterium]